MWNISTAAYSTWKRNPPQVYGQPDAIDPIKQNSESEVPMTK